LSITEAC